MTGATTVGTGSMNDTPSSVRGPSPRLWPILAIGVMMLHLLVSEIGMFPDWDESVFYSQSGGIVGVDSDPSSYAASREPGTPLLIAGLRELGLNLEATRLAFLGIYLSLTTLAFYLMAPVMGWGAVVGFAVVSLHWIPLAFSARFYGVPIASACLLVAMAAASWLLREDRRSWRWFAAALLAVSSLAMLAMRHLEAPLAATVLFLVLIVSAWRDRARRWLAIGAAGTTLLAIFLVDTARAIYYHGSLAEWVGALSAQLQGVSVNPDGPVVRLLKVLGSLGAGYHLRFESRLPLIWVVTTLAALVLFLAAVVLGRRRSGEPLTDRVRVARSYLWWGSGVIFLGYLSVFVFARYPSIPADRYLMWFVASGAVLAGLLLRGTPDRVEALALGLAGLLLVIGGVATARPDIQYLLEDGERMRQLGATMVTLAAGTECEALSRYTAPALQLASGCRVRSVSDPEVARGWLTEPSEEETVRFLLFPEVPELEDISGWTTTAGSGNPYVLWYRSEE